MGKPDLERIQLVMWDLYIQKGNDLNEIDENHPLVQLDFSPTHPDWDKNQWTQIYVEKNEHLGVEFQENEDFLAIYRTEINVPNEWAGSSVALEIENFSGKYWLFVNEKEVETGFIERDLLQNQLITPLNINISNFISYGAGNIIALKIISLNAGSGISGDVS